jgi:ABC-type dipeptide/oligopeptide/nickel transport system permease component
VDSLVFRDFPVAQASFMLIGILVVITYLASDVLAAWLDPRARSTERARA